MGGIERLGFGLFSVAELLLPERVKQAGYYPKLKDAWMKAFKDLAIISARIREDITDYSERAMPDKLVGVVVTSVSMAMQVTRGFLSGGAAHQLARYFEGVDDTMKAVAKGWRGLARGDVAAAAAFLHDGLQDTLEAVLPQQQHNHSIYAEVFGALDKPVAQLNDYVMTYKRKLMESQVCRRKAQPRRKRWAQHCGSWPGYTYADHGVCEKGVPLTQIGSLDTALTRKSGGSTSKDALCDPSSDYPEQIGKHCYKDCPAGWVPTTEGEMCLVECHGDKPSPSESADGVAGDGVLCGSSPRMVSMTTVEMGAAPLAGTLTVPGVIQELVADGRAGAVALRAVVAGGIKLGVPFVHPNCIVQAAESPQGGRAPAALPRQVLTRARALVRPSPVFLMVLEGSHWVAPSCAPKLRSPGRATRGREAPCQVWPGQTD
eukprot:CAMPEP_0204540784 /NCGR_PEP_ID=MMETSP0661-20131031/17742_1 /ASSEMBLY_ACC=CAM_ASM_000606 /TAXON_ID=109239 /ORGANISM="Alexandrium margalefi, Strain AMGDE01CS-322" /LENGTH=431 /DNA_ID=CAMNT_0051547443 /DNA_START=66 /DNA_END=1359 /DNA_ORIENTATION=-